MINIVSYSTAKGNSGKGGSGSGGGGNVTNYNTYTGIQPLYLWGHYFDGSQDVDGDLTADGNIKANNLEAKDKVKANIIEALSATTEYFKSAYIESTGNANVSGSTTIRQNLEVGGTSKLKGNTTISGSTSMSGDLSAGGNANIVGRATIGSDTTINGKANIGSDTTIGGNANISGDTFTDGSSTVHHNLTAGGNATIYGNATISGTTRTTDIYSENITNTDTIRTKDLEVTGKAHFFELIIDKIKAAGGAVLLTPADGFDIDYVEDVTNGKKLYFRSTDKEGRGIMNMWEIGDQAICQSFNEAKVGTSYNVSNKYWWSLVTDVSEQPVQKTVSGQTNDYHYITISTQSGTDASGRTYYDGSVNPEIGDSVAMLGSRNENDKKRQSADYLAAYTSIDLGLTAPLFATYQGINDFNLASHRGSYIDAYGARFVGGLYVDSSTSVQDYITNETTEIRNEFKFDIDGLTSVVSHKSRPNILTANGWTDQEDRDVFQDDEEYEISASTISDEEVAIAFPPVVYLNAGDYTMSMYATAKYKDVKYGNTKENLDYSFPIQTMVNENDIWHGEKRSVTVFRAPVNGYYQLGAELMDASYSGDTPYVDYNETSGQTPYEEVETETEYTSSKPYAGLGYATSGTTMVTPEDYEGLVTYESSNPEIMTVDGKGVVTMHEYGSATITAKANEWIWNGKIYKQSSDEQQYDCISGLQTEIVLPPTIEITSGTTYQLEPVVTPSEYDGILTYQSSDPTKATVDANGLVTYDSTDDVTIIVTAATKLIEGITYSGSTTSTIVGEQGGPIGVRVTIGNIVYETARHRTVKVVSGVYGISGDIEIPREVEISGRTYGVTEISNNAFSYKSNITSVTIPNSVTRIADGAFRNCANLQSVTLPNSITHIGSLAFSEDRKLQSINIPESVEYIGSLAFDYTPWWTSYSGDTSHQYGTFIYINDVAYKAVSESISTCEFKPNTVSISGRALYSCQNITTVTIPNTVKSIGNQTFRFCSSLQSISVPDNVTSIESYVFGDCRSLTSATLGRGITNIPSNTFNICPNLTSVTINGAVTSIGENAFAYTSNLTSITIPNTVKIIGKTAFYRSNLQSVVIPDSVTEMRESAFAECGSLASLTIGSGLTVIPKEAFIQCRSLTSLVIPDNVIEIGQGAFSTCNLSTVTIGSGVTTIGGRAFINYTITTMTCMPLTPPTLGSTTMAITTLRVPAEAYNDYLNSDWANYATTITPIS